MPKLPRVTSEQMARALRRAGFADDRQKGSHLTMLNPKSRRRVVVPMHGRVLGTGLTHDILKQAGLTVEQFCELLK